MDSIKDSAAAGWLAERGGRLAAFRDRHRAKLVAAGDFLVVFGAMALVVASRELGPVAAVALAIWAYVRGQSSGYDAGLKAGRSQASIEAAQREMEIAKERVDRILAERSTR